MEARKHAENTVKAGRFANVTNPCTAGKKAGTGKRTRWRAARARARPASLPWRNARHAFALPLEFLTEGAETMENAIVSVLFAFPPQSVKTITCDRGAELPTGAGSRSDCIVRPILPTSIVAGRKARTRIEQVKLYGQHKKASIM